MKLLLVLKTMVFIIFVPKLKPLFGSRSIHVDIHDKILPLNYLHKLHSFQKISSILTVFSKQCMYMHAAKGATVQDEREWVSLSHGQRDLAYMNERDKEWWQVHAFDRSTRRPVGVRSVKRGLEMTSLVRQARISRVTRSTGLASARIALRSS